jgi:hypothetical protein
MCYGYDKDSREPLWKYASDNNVIGLQHPKINEIWYKVPEREKKKITKAWSKAWYNQYVDFCDKMEHGDIVLIIDGHSALMGVGRVKEGKVEFKNIPKSKKYPEGFFDHIRCVEWLIRYNYNEKIPFDAPGFYNTIRYVDRRSFNWDVLIKRDIDIKTSASSSIKKTEKERKRRKNRKYGVGGEGKEHKKLKELISSNPKRIGIKNETDTHIEYDFEFTGDRADIVFDLPSNRYATIEIETYDPFPGVFQALKYKVLLEAELDWNNKNPQGVDTYLVAYTPLNTEEEEMCKKLGVKFVKIDK